MSRLNLMDFTIFLLHLLIVATVAEAYPETVTTIIRNGDEIIMLNLQLTRRYLASNSLPVWSAWRNRAPILMTDVMERVGPFAMYHDLEQSASAIYTEKSRSFFGLIDTRFYIENLPLSLAKPNIYHDVNGPYVKLRDQGTSFHDNIHVPRNFPYVSNQDMQYLNNFNVDLLDPVPVSSHDPSKQHSNGIHRAGSSHHNGNCISRASPVGDDLYMEILVFVSHDIVEYYNRPGYSVVSLVAYYLIQFNAIDMLFAKLAADGIMIHINIAGLVLEAESIVFPYVYTPNQPQPYEKLDLLSTLKKMTRYIKKYRNIFVEDSFDFFFLSTDYMLMHDTTVLDGAALSGFSLYDNRKNLRAIPDSYGLAVRRKSISADFITSTHELSHLMKLTHDEPTEGCVGNVQCYGILQPIGSYCRYCIEWSSRSLLELQRFVSSDIDRCFLLNKPRSLHPYGLPMTTISPHRQCRCYGFESHWVPIGNHLDEVLSNSCNKKLACAWNNNLVHYQIPRPFDGTPCGRNNVCWRRECQSLIRA